jgi:nitroreductase
MELMMHPSVTVAEVLYDRRSVREFIKKSIPRNTLEAVLTYSARWADPGTRVGDDVAIHVLAKDVGGMDKTLYSYCPDEGVLKARTDEIPPSNIARLLNAAVEGDPSVVVIFTGRLVAAVEKDGLCGYQRLFVDAGVTAHRMWLSAISFGLRGVPIAGIVRSEARAQLGLDDYHDLPLLALVLGYAKEAR